MMACQSKILSEDRLSSLPNDLLTHILSFLTSKQSVSTSVLSTRWKYLFASVPSLHFDSSEHKNNSYDTHKNCIRGEHENFVKFVNRVLRLYNLPCIRSFRFFTSSIHVFDVTSWICAAIRLNPQLLEVSAGNSKDLFLPASFFNCQTLVHLKLYGNIVFSRIGPLCLPSLKTCELNECKFERGVSARRFFSSCPVLEDLTLNNCDSKYLKVFSIFVPSLKRLTIRSTYDQCEWELNVPNLEYINCQSARGRWYSVNILKSLHKAEIYLGSYGRAWDMDENDDRIRELVNKFKEVQFVSLTGYSMEVFACPSSLMPTFDKLTTLELKVRYCIGSKSFPRILEKSPCLELLVIEENGFLRHDQMFSESNVLLPKLIPLCFLQSLKEVKLRKCGGNQVEYKWLGYFLKNAMILEKLTIHVRLRFHGESAEMYSTYLKRQDEIKKKLLVLPRGSKACQIRFGEK